jgi:hypothetical protein
MRIAGYRCLFVWLLMPTVASANGLTLGPRSELTHPGKGHEVRISAASVAVARDGGVFLAWGAEEGPIINLYLAHVSAAGGQPVRVNPEGLAVDSLHQSPGLDIGPGGEIYVSWSSSKAKPAGTLFASDLRLSRSLNGGKSFDSHVRVNEDRPLSHSFEGLSVADDGTVLLSWIDSRDGGDKAATYLARIVKRGTQVERVLKLDSDSCVCCRVDLTTGPKKTVAVVWRKVFPDNIRDMVVAVSRHSGRAFEAPVLVHADRWQIAACPHRGGIVLRAMDTGMLSLMQLLACYSERAGEHSALP